MFSANNPYGGVNPLIDKMIGNAYDIVKYVARYLKEIRYCAENMQSIYTAANGNKYVLEAVAADTLLEIALPEELDISTITGITAIAIGGDGSIYLPGSDTFNFGVDGSLGAVVISIITAGTPLFLDTATYKVFINYNPVE